jgi:hypothetical protein
MLTLELMTNCKIGRLRLSALFFMVLIVLLISENLNINMTEELILISACQRSLILCAYSISILKVTLTCTNDLTGPKVLIGERMLCNAVTDIFFTSKSKFEKLST